MGKLDDHVTPRLSTLNILAQFVGTESWDAFQILQKPQEDHPRSFPVREDNSYQGEGIATDVSTHLFRREWPRRLLWLILLFFVLFAAFWGVRRYRTYTDHVMLLQDSLERASSRQYLLQSGQHFASYDDYLQLFGLVDVKEYPYFQIHPQHPHLVLWGPEYHHPHWHNDGDASLMMPTITEHWEPVDTIPELVAMRNAELYYNGRRNRDIRLTFMKGLDGDTGFVFLGVYRFSLTQSDTTHIVWERVAEEANLLHLDALEQFRE